MKMYSSGLTLVRLLFYPVKKEKEKREEKKRLTPKIESHMFCIIKLAFLLTVYVFESSNINQHTRELIIARNT